jgi:hypothetical protein
MPVMPHAISGRKHPLATRRLQINPDKAWFAYFRLYGPQETYLNRSWKLLDIEKMN